MTKIEFDFFCFAPLQKNYEINIFYSVFWRNQGDLIILRSCNKFDKIIFSDNFECRFNKKIFSAENFF